MNPSKLTGTLWTLPIREWGKYNPTKLSVTTSGLPSFFIKESIQTITPKLTVPSYDGGFWEKKDVVDYDLEVIFRIYNNKFNFLGRWSNNIYLHCNCQFSTLNELIKNLPYSNTSTKNKWQLEGWKDLTWVYNPTHNHWGDFISGNKKLLKNFMERYASVRFADNGMIRDSNGEYKNCYYYEQNKRNTCDGWIDKMLNGKVPDFSNYSSFDTNAIYKSF